MPFFSSCAKNGFGDRLLGSTVSFQIKFQRALNRAKLLPMTRYDPRRSYFSYSSRKGCKKSHLAGDSEGRWQITGLDYLRVSWPEQHVSRAGAHPALGARVANGGFGHPSAMPEQREYSGNSKGSGDLPLS